MRIRLPRYERGEHIPSNQATGRDEQFEWVEFVLWPGDSFVFFDGAGVYLVHQATAPAGTSTCMAVFDLDLQVGPPCICPASALHLPCIRPASALHLPCIFHTLQYAPCT